MFTVFTDFNALLTAAARLAAAVRRAACLQKGMPG